MNYDSQIDLRFALRGIDLVISTVSGNPQINLIDAAAHSGVRRFIPAEFEGPVSRRPRNDPLDRGRAACLDRLRHWSRSNHHRMPFTVFSCGVFYERFARGGLGSLGIGAGSNVYYQGTYLMDVGMGTAKVVENTASGRPIQVSMISVQDVGRFVVAALDLRVQNWPEEFTMQGDRRTVTEILRWAESVKGGGGSDPIPYPIYQLPIPVSWMKDWKLLLTQTAEFATEIIQARDLRAHLEHAEYYQDYATVAYIHELMATEQRRYDISQPNLNALVNVEPTPFWDWLRLHWGAV